MLVHMHMDHLEACMCCTVGAVWKGGTDASTGPNCDGIEVIVGPLLEGARDLKYGVVHSRSNVRVVVDVEIVVADMHAEIQLASKACTLAHAQSLAHVHRAVLWGVQANGSPCHCPLCDAALKPLGSIDPWGEVAANTDKQESLACNTYGDLLQRWSKYVAPRRARSSDEGKTLAQGYRKDTLGFGQARPPLARVNFNVCEQSPSKWARPFEEHEIAPPCTTFVKVDLDSEPEGKDYDTFNGTEQECHQAQHLLMRLVMVMDEFHARGNLIDALRDAIEQRVRWRGDRAVGVHMWQAAWSRWGHMDFYKLNWRGYGHAHVHACTCLNVLGMGLWRCACMSGL